jgi:hypothetical protein
MAALLAAADWVGTGMVVGEYNPFAPEHMAGEITRPPLAGASDPLTSDAVMRDRKRKPVSRERSPTAQWLPVSAERKNRHIPVFRAASRFQGGFPFSGRLFIVYMKIVLARNRLYL